jgi:hypothetical protein
MSLVPYNSDILQALKWMQNNAPAIQSLLNKKSAWYQQYQTNFWQQWTENVFDIRSANPFGLMIWCIILGVPSEIFGLFPLDNSWAYGPLRQNFVYSGLHPVANPNLVGGNFYGGGNTTVVNLVEVRQALQLRYAALVSNGRIEYINRMLKNIFSPDDDWSFPEKKYFYCTDLTAPAQTLTPTAPVTTPFYLEYRIGINTKISAQFLGLMNSPQYGIMPVGAACRYLVKQES